jgi:hypothetical protein
LFQNGLASSLICDETAREIPANQRYQGRKPEPRAYVQGLDVRTMSGRGRNIFLDILFIERYQAMSQACAVYSPHRAGRVAALSGF